AAKRAGRRDRDVEALRVRRVDDDGVKAEAARPGLPQGGRRVRAQAVEFLPGGAAVGAPEERRVLAAGVDRVGIVERGLEVPDPLELPGVRRAVVPLV